MFSKDGRGSAAATVVLSASTAMAGFATLAFVSASFWIQSVQDRWSILERSANHISWLGHVDIRIDRKREPIEDLVQRPALQPVLQKESIQLVAPKKSGVLARVRARSKSRGASKLLSNRIPTAPMAPVATPEADLVPLSAASVPPVQIAANPGIVHQNLKLRFHELAEQMVYPVAETHSEMEMPLLVDAVPVPTTVPTVKVAQKSPNPRRKHSLNVVAVAETKKSKKVSPTVAPFVAKEVYGPELKDPKWILSGLNTHSLEKQIKVIRDELSLVQAKASPSPLYVSPIGPDPLVVGNIDEETLASSTIAATEQAEAQPAEAEAAKDVAPSAPATTIVISNPAPTQAVTTQKGSLDEYSIAMNTQMDSQRQFGNVTVSRPDAARREPAKSETLAQNEKRSEPVSPDPDTFDLPEEEETPIDTSGIGLSAAPLAQEAFAENMILEHAERSIFAADGKQAKDDGFFWTITASINHYPTLSRTQKIGGQEMTTVELLSLNTLRGLGELSGAVHSEAKGIVFGKLPKGWTAQLSGIAEPARTLNGSFYFLNVEPGAAVLYVTDEKGEAKGGLPLPVLAGIATYVPDAQPYEFSLAGRTYDGSAHEPRFIPNISIQVVGQEKAQTRSIRNGTYSLPKVQYWPGFPLWVDVAEETEGEMRRQRHRIEIASDVVEKDFYVLAEAQIKVWLDQLSGGVSAGSALAISALPKALQSLSSSPMETFEALTTKDTSPEDLRAPETYTLSKHEHLVRRDQLSAAAPRLLSVELPSGVSRIQVSSRAQKVVFSELILPTPKVLCVIGPQ